VVVFFFFSSRRRHTRLQGDWSSDVCSSDLEGCQDNRKPPMSASGFVPEPPKNTLAACGYPGILRDSCAALRDICTGGSGRGPPRSEERRVGKEWRSQWAAEHCNEQRESGSA